MNKQNKSQERTLLTGMLMSAPGPILELIAVLSSSSATQIADFIRRTAELAASFVSWIVYRKMQKRPEDGAYHARLSKIAGYTVATAMLCSGAAMCVVGILRLLQEGEAGGNVTMGLIIAALGLVANTIFFLRYRTFNRRAPDPVIAAQQRLYRAKVSVDACVTIALAAVAIIPGHPATRYIDAIGSLVVAAYLLISGAAQLRDVR